LGGLVGKQFLVFRSITLGADGEQDVPAAFTVGDGNGGFEIYFFRAAEFAEMNDGRLSTESVENTFDFSGDVASAKRIGSV
jgi:hypothetical protein